MQPMMLFLAFARDMDGEAPWLSNINVPIVLIP